MACAEMVFSQGKVLLLYSSLRGLFTLSHCRWVLAAVNQALLGYEHMQIEKSGASMVYADYFPESVPPDKNGMVELFATMDELYPRIEETHGELEPLPDVSEHPDEWSDEQLNKVLTMHKACAEEGLFERFDDAFERPYLVIDHSLWKEKEPVRYKRYLKLVVSLRDDDESAEIEHGAVDEDGEPVTTMVPIDSEEAAPFVEDAMKGRPGFPDPPEHSLPDSSHSTGYPEEGWRNG
ncbi:MAG: hypothetical protein U5N86_00850 [Planctomycetota bacterium]|nr:hypothetical protein [Planctomycetota bacterium]